MNTDEPTQTVSLQEIAWNESTLDTCACELLDHATPETGELWSAFSRALQADLRAKFGEDVFENF